MSEQISSAAALPTNAVHHESEGGFIDWLATHRAEAAMAALLAFAGPLTFFVGALSVMRVPTPANILRLGLWWLAYGLTLTGLLTLAGYACLRSVPRLGRLGRMLLWLAAAGVVAVGTNAVTAGRATIVVDQGLVYSSVAMHVHGFVVSMTMALLYFAHLQRSVEHRRAATRLAVAQAAQRTARRRIVRLRVQEMQARIDPQMLFRMLRTVRNLYETDPDRAERFLDELVSFLRAALTAVRDVSSSLARETELARAFMRLQALAGPRSARAVFEIAADASHASFPPGVLLPLLDSAVAADASDIKLSAARRAGSVHVMLAVDAGPSDEALASVRALLTELHGPAAEVSWKTGQNSLQVEMKVPYEHA